MDLQGARLAVMTNIDKKGAWSFSGYMEHRWNGENLAGAQVVFWR